VRKAALRLRGANAVVVVSSRAPDKIVAFRLGNAGGIVVGYGENEMLLASDLPALVPHTRKVLYLAGGEMVVLTPGSAVYSTLAGETLQKRPQLVQYDALSAAKGEYRHYMLKEINQQPEAVADTLGGRLNFEDAEIVLEDFPYSDEELLRIERVVLIGMGTSMHAAMVGRTWMEDLARIPTEVDNSSEFRYRNPVLNERTLVISISQSGETADTLAAMEEAMRQGAKQITLCNYAGTQTTRLADGTILIRSGPEIGVAATKTFVCSLVSLYLLSMYIARRRGTIARERLLELMQELMHLPGMMASYLADQSAYEPLAQKYLACKDFLFLGRGINFPLAMEGALKLKEISYIHAEGYPAGEMKHGPISLIDGAMPVLAIIPKDELYEKMLSNINEVKARSGTVIAVATEGDEEIGKHVDQVIRIPRASRYVTPIIMALPLQLLAYHIAVLLGKDVDQPRNLAKSVTVE